MITSLPIFLSFGYYEKDICDSNESSNNNVDIKNGGKNDEDDVVGGVHCNNNDENNNTDNSYIEVERMLKNMTLTALTNLLRVYTIDK
jgi:hypothetical protein